MTRPRDPPREALDRHISSSDEPQPLERANGLRPGRTIRLTTPRSIGMIAGVVALLGTAAFGGYLSFENHDRADRWRDRSVLLQDLVAERTKALNRQTARLNVASTRLRGASRAISRSEQDVAQLEVRQRELADEKAQIEDERAALLGTAGQLESCNAGMGSLIQIISSGFQPDPVELDNLVSVCATADGAVDAYVQTYGSR